jgi:hypothetical protein
MKKALAGFFVFAAYLQSDGVVAAERDCPAKEVPVGSECVKMTEGHAHIEVPHEDGGNDKITKDAEERAAREETQKQIEEIVKGVLKETIKER